MAEDYDTDEEELRERPPARQPRLGSFVTIAAAILVLFGAAGRVGRMPEVPALLGIDRAHEAAIQNSDRARAIQHIGAVPSSYSSLHPQQGAMSIMENAEPPVRPDTGLRPPAVSIAVPDDRQTGSESLQPPLNGSLRPGAETFVPPQPERGGRLSAENRDTRSWNGTYVVAAGDTWVKIAKKTLGDGSRWQELQRANPSAQNGLRVGMRLSVPN